MQVDLIALKEVIFFFVFHFHLLKADLVNPGSNYEKYFGWSDQLIKGL